MASRFSAYFSFIRNTCTFNHCECLQQILLRSVNSMVFLRMVKKYVFICCKYEECLYMSEICVHQVNVISHCKRSPPPSSSTQQRGTRSTSTKEREMVSFKHFLYSHHFLVIVCANFNPEADENLVLKPTIYSQRLQRAQLI